jgi:hypothetical protein
VYLFSQQISLNIDFIIWKDYNIHLRICEYMYTIEGVLDICLSFTLQVCVHVSNTYAYLKCLRHVFHMYNFSDESYKYYYYHHHPPPPHHHHDVTRRDARGAACLS